MAVQSVLNNIINTRLGDKGRELGQGQKNDPPGSPVGPYNHGNDGLFYMPQSNNQLVSTLIMPRGGLMDVIPVLNRDPFDNVMDTNMFGSKLYSFDTIMTGLTEGDIEDFSNQPTDDCADGPTGGLVKLCTLMNTMGRYRGSTREVSLFQAGQAFDRLDFEAHTLLNSSPGLREFFGTPDDMPEQNAIIMNEMARRLFEVLASFRRFFSRRIWIGSPANNSGQRRDIMGMELHINAGNKIDAFTGAICESADSIVMDFGKDLVNGSGRDIIEYMEAAEYANRVNAERMGLSPLNGVLVMRESLFDELTKVVPVKQYQEVLAALANQPNSDNTRMMIDATGAQADRDRFRNQMVLPLNGRLYKVVIDDGITETTAVEDAALGSGQFLSDIFFVPLTAMGSLPATFFQFFNHDNQQARNILQRVAPNAFTFVSDGGQFRWHIDYSKGCLKFNFEFAPWLKVKFPFLGWRISDVRYEPTIRPRDSNPASDYFANGGNVATSGQFPSGTVLYPAWDTNGFAV